MESQNSPTNQKIKGQLVAREIRTQVNEEVEFILSAGDESHSRPAPYSWDDVTNVYHVSRDDLDHHLQMLDEDDIFELCEELDIGSVEEAFDDDLQEYLERYHNFEPTPAEILEWWKVSDWFARKLDSHGECVILEASIWGRQTSGQAILLDPVISEIAAEMNILEGMDNEWETQ